MILNVPSKPLHVDSMRVWNTTEDGCPYIPVEVRASFPAARDAYLTDVIRDGVSTNPDSIGVERVDATPPSSTHAQILNPPHYQLTCKQEAHL